MAENGINDASRSQWSNAAEGWAEGSERREEGPSGAAADWMLEAAAPAPGERVLELACGAGDVGFRAAEAVGGTGRVVCSDFAEPMEEVVRERAAARDLEQVEGRVLDAERLDLGGDRFDVILCRMGLMLMSDPSSALRGSAEALDRDGRLAVAVWGAPDGKPWLSAVTDATMEVLGAPPPAPGAPGPFALADHGRLGGLIAGAGLADVVVEDIESARRHDSLDDWWAEMLRGDGPMGALLSGLPEDRREAIREMAYGLARPCVQDDGAVLFPAVVVGAAATRP